MAVEGESPVHQALGMCCCQGDPGWSVPCAGAMTSQTTGGMSEESCAKLSTASLILQSTELYRQVQCAVRECDGSVGAVGKATLKMLKIP